MRFVSTLATRLARLDQTRRRTATADRRRNAAARRDLNLTNELLEASTPTPSRHRLPRIQAAARDQEPTDEQLAEVEQEAMTAALQPVPQTHAARTRSWTIKGVA